MITRQTRKDRDMPRTKEIAKESSTAACGQEDECPSNKEIWSLLLEIQQNTAKLLTDNQEQRKLYKDLKNSLEFETSKREELEEKVTILEKKLEQEAKRSKDTAEKFHEEQIKLDDLQQYTRKYNLEISGVTRDTGSSDRELVLSIAEEIGVNINNDDIDIVHRLKKPNNKPCPIIVRFSTYAAKQRLYAARKNLRKAEWSTVLGYDTTVYFNENLTPRRSKIYREVRKVVKEKKLFGSWTIDGKIFVKNDKDSYPIMIKSMEDIDKL